MLRKKNLSWSFLVKAKAGGVRNSSFWMSGSCRSEPGEESRGSALWGAWVKKEGMLGSYNRGKGGTRSTQKSIGSVETAGLSVGGFGGKKGGKEGGVKGKAKGKFVL